MYRWFSCRWLDAGRFEKADDSKWVCPSLLIHGWRIALGATARPTKPASSSTVTGGRKLSSNPSSVIGRRGSRTPSWSWLRGGSSGRRPLFCPRSARAAAASRCQAQARRINFRGCVVAGRARSFGHHGGGRGLESCGLVSRGLERERRHSANAGHRHQAAAHLVVPSAQTHS